MQFKPVITLVSDHVAAVSADAAFDVQLADGSYQFVGLQDYNSLIFLINVTDEGTATGTVNIRILDSWDGGTTWDTLVSSLQLTLGTTTGTQRFVVQGQIAAATITTATSTALTQGSAVTTTLAAGSARQGPFGDRIKIVETIAGTGGTPVGATYSIHMIPNRSQDS